MRVERGDVAMTLVISGDLWSVDQRSQLAKYGEQIYRALVTP